jgi:hypothetical protein
MYIVIGIELTAYQLEQGQNPVSKDRQNSRYISIYVLNSPV